MATEPVRVGAIATVCSDCGTPVDPAMLACPACHALTRSAELESIAARARQATLAADLVSARDLWEQASALLPNETVQYQSVRARIAELETKIGERKAPAGPWGKRVAALGPAAIVVWKFKAFALLFLTKGKLLLLGLTKMSTLLSMLAFAGVYWAMFGWVFALGIVFSIYVHEMGHVLALRGYGIPADAPMFIPGLGAFIRLRRLHISPVQDARVGLAGPIYGLGAAIAALCVYGATGWKAWSAIAHFGAVINLFNLIPVWQLDGSRGLRSLSQQQRIVVLATAAVLWMVSSEPMLFLIALACGFRLFTKDASPQPDRPGLVRFISVTAALALISALAQRVAR